MKKSAFLLIIVALSVNSCILDGWNNGISGNGHVEEESRDVSGFSGVHASTGIDVFISEGNSYDVKVEADENLLEVILTELNGNMLVIKTDRVNIRSAKSKKVYVTMPKLKELKISSAGDCKGMTPFNCDDLRISVSSAGDLKLDVEANRIDINISSSGDATLTGRTGVLDAILSSAGDLQAFDLIAETVSVDVSSAGDARVYASEEISMNASSAGNIYYKGEADVVHSRSSSAGDIVKK
jgi:hypothetical protein